MSLTLTHKSFQSRQHQGIMKKNVNVTSWESFITKEHSFNSDRSQVRASTNNQDISLPQVNFKMSINKAEFGTILGNN